MNLQRPNNRAQLNRIFIPNACQNIQAGATLQQRFAQAGGVKEWSRVFRGSQVDPDRQGENPQRRRFDSRSASGIDQ